ncbi:MAG: CehA/McbA family metallohydrolase [SAR202 cluster bacterium]|nr:CehA/McbA family metallohydrolase [SAR202 cluster bacterium]
MSALQKSAFGRLATNRGNVNVTGSIIDKDSGEQVPARVQVTGASGNFIAPDNAIQKVGQGAPFFYSDGRFAVTVNKGPTRVVVERGTEYVPTTINLEAPSHGTVTVDIEIERWSDLGNRGWHPGNTHIHYDEKETRPDERLQLDPRVEDLRMTAVSILKRWDFDYATNKYTPGMLTEFSSDHHHVQCGEENRHDAPGRTSGYGHIMLLNIHNVVDPISRGLLVDSFDPDYPPLSYACDDTRRQGGIVIWCHNGQGMEAPVAAALGKVDAFNLFDPNWADAEYDIYYRMLNAGIKLPASTGSDWFVCSANRVYAYTGAEFEYGGWLTALKNGATFITNGPALSLEVDGQLPGAEVNAKPGQNLSSIASWTSHYPISRAEILYNGSVVASNFYPSGTKMGNLKADICVPADGWIVARLSSSTRDSFSQPIFAHTSPVYIKTGLKSAEMKNAAAFFDQEIEDSLIWVGTKGKFYNNRHRKEVIDLFREGQQVYKSMLK